MLSSAPPCRLSGTALCTTLPASCRDCISVRRDSLHPRQRQQRPWRQRQPSRQQRLGRAPAAASAAADADSGTHWGEVLDDMLSQEGGWDSSSPDLQACVARGGALVAWLTGHEGVGLQLAVQVAMGQCRIEAANSDSHDRDSSNCGGSGTSTSPTSAPAGVPTGPGAAPAQGGLVAAKFELFRRLTSAEPGWASSLAQVLADSEAALALGLADSEAALRFASTQLQRVSRRRYEAVRHPYSLPRLFLLHPHVGGALLAQHPAGFIDRAAPWLRGRLGWGDAQLADAALSPHFSELCQLDTTTAQAALDWLVGPAGLNPRQAAPLLAPPGLRLLVAPPAQLRQEQARAEQLAGEWGVGLGLAAALALGQEPMAASSVDATGQLVATLQGPVGMSEAQVLEFVLGGGLEGGCSRSQAALERATERLKQLLLVHGSWPAVAAALAEQPEQLSMSWQGLESTLEAPQQQAAWRAVGAMHTANEEG